LQIAEFGGLRIADCGLIAECRLELLHDDRRASLALLTCVVVLAFVPTRGQGKRFNHGKGSVKFTWIADAQSRPTARLSRFVRVTVNEKENRYEASLFARAGEWRRKRLGGSRPGSATRRHAWSPTVSGRVRARCREGR